MKIRIVGSVDGAGQINGAVVVPLRSSAAVLPERGGWKKMPGLFVSHSPGFGRCQRPPCWIESPLLQLEVTETYLQRLI